MLETVGNWIIWDFIHMAVYGVSLPRWSLPMLIYQDNLLQKQEEKIGLAKKLDHKQEEDRMDFIEKEYDYLRSLFGITPEMRGIKQTHFISVLPPEVEYSCNFASTPVQENNMNGLFDDEDMDSSKISTEERTRQYFANELEESYND